MKKLAILISAVYCAYFLFIIALSSFCDSPFCKVREDEPLGVILVVFLSLVPVFLLSLITYKLPEQVFQAWWSVARWFVPIIVVITFLTNYGHQQSGFGGVAQGAFSFVFLFLLYAAFIITALTRIFFAYRKTKRVNV